METNYYRNFLAIVESGNITAASEFLHITQPTLSKQLQILEKAYNTNLIVTKRGARSIFLTDAGKLLYRRAKQICSLEDLATDEVASTTKTVSGPLRFSISQGRSSRFIKRILSGFAGKYPNVRFELYEGIITQQQEQLLSGLTDLGVCNTELTQPDRFNILFTREEKLALIASSDFKDFPESPQISLDQLRNIPIAISGGCAVLLGNTLGSLEDSLKLVCISTTKFSALSWVSTGKVAAVVPIEPGEIVSPDMKVAYLDGNFTLKKSVICPKDRPVSHVAKVFLDYYGELHKQNPD